MKSKYNPLLFRTLASGAALFALTSLHAETIDTTGTTIVLNASDPQNTYIGDGTLQVSGGGTLALGTGPEIAETDFAMTGGLIEIVSGTALANGGWQRGVWTNNLASMQVDGVLDLNDGNPVFIDALTGTGSVTTTNWTADFVNSRTLTVGVNNGSGTFSGTITQDSVHVTGLTKIGGGTQTLTGPNTYTGVTLIAGGTLNAATFSDYGDASSLGNRAADGSQDVGILFRGGTLQYTGSTPQSTDRAIRINADGGGGNPGGATIDASGSDPAATLSFTATSSPDFFEWSGTRTLTLTGTNTGDNTFAMAITEVGITSFVKNGSGTWVLTGANSYTGNTTVNEGTLRLGNGTENSNLDDSADVIVAAGATLHLDFTGTDDIDELWLGGVQQDAGIYGAGTYSGATIAGIGSLNVLTGPPIADPFIAWIDTFFPGETDPLVIGATADPDNDGIENLVEYVLQGGDPSVSNTGILPTLDASGANFVFTYLRRTAATGTTQTFQYGSDLSGWTDVPVTDGGLVSITSPEGGVEQVVITIPKGTETKLFGRLQVVK